MWTRVERPLWTSIARFEITTEGSGRGPGLGLETALRGANGAPCADRDDCACYWAWPSPAGHRKWGGRPRDRGANGYCDPGRPADIDGAQLARATHARPSRWAV